MPQAPTLDPAQMQQAQATGGVGPAQFLIAAADLHAQGALPSQTDKTSGPMIGKKISAKRPLKVVK